MAAGQYLAEAISPWDISKARAVAERSGVDAHCIGLAYVAHNEMALGYPDRAQAAMAESLRDAQQLGHAQTMGHCLGLAGWLAVYSRDLAAARRFANLTIDYCREQQLTFWEAGGFLVDGWALIQGGKPALGVERMKEGFAIRRAAGAALVHASFYSVLAECHGQAGDFDAGLTLVEEGLKHVEWSGERMAESELHRVRGELLLSKTSDLDAAVRCFGRALEVAREQHAKLFELRAAASLARLWRAQGRRTAALDVLLPVHNWFTEGFDTTDVREAKALAAELKG
jgi:predicted ATPase